VANETDGASAPSAHQYEAVALIEQPTARTVVTETRVTDTVVVTQPGGGTAPAQPASTPPPQA
jgi:hypothetical protein